jgi:hypothetical protein
VVVQSRRAISARSDALEFFSEEQSKAGQDSTRRSGLHLFRHPYLRMPAPLRSRAEVRPACPCSYTRATPSPVPGNRGREEVDLKPINDVTLRFILEHSILAIGLVPNSLTVFTVKLDNVDGQKHDRQRGQQKQAAHGSSGTSSGAYEKHSWGINPYGRAVKCLAGCGHRAPFHISRSHLNFRLAPYENL